ncbi:hypothetical protein SAMN04489712_113144 [Thermomonospora echinospora]|uniref:Uncharacterized protein n=1 Tax=Thermomonospora echinospora TaxID=1992 RepID=A0A1H6D6N1_9ACTN|nr:hypothetical protein [Thermomonospora echinospora]SEG80744.1 hypothetical protein SAMN04489712_113144 [Thermomonospora echinospora]
MSHQVADAVAEIAAPLEELLAGCDHVVSIYLCGVTEAGEPSRAPVELAGALYTASGIPLCPAVAERVGRPWRDRLHQLVHAQIPTVRSWPPKDPPELELSADEIERVTALTDDLAEVLEAHLGPVRRAYELSSHGGSYREIPPDMCCSHDIVWNDLLLVTKAWATLLHIGLSD